MPKRSGIHRFKPRVSARVQYALAACLWIVAAAILAFRGVEWLADSRYAMWLFGLAAILAALKLRYVLEPTALRAVTRIAERGTEQCAGGFFSWQAWALVFAMMAGGHALRLTAISRPALGVLYMTISLALLAGSTRFVRAALAPRC